MADNNVWHPDQEYLDLLHDFPEMERYRLIYGTWKPHNYQVTMSCPDCQRGIINAFWSEHESPHLRCPECGIAFTITVEKANGKP